VLCSHVGQLGARTLLPDHVLTNGKVTEDMVGPHGDLPPEFSHLRFSIWGLLTMPECHSVSFRATLIVRKHIISGAALSARLTTMCRYRVMPRPRFIWPNLLRR
jgi:hypothetical protein